MKHEEPLKVLVPLLQIATLVSVFEGNGLIKRKSTVNTIIHGLFSLKFQVE